MKTKLVKNVKAQDGSSVSYDQEIRFDSTQTEQRGRLIACVAFAATIYIPTCVLGHNED